ncbi:phenylacetate--CoA ligase [Ramlibacter sp.]|uniref:phenylacetate--CoA ligase family protein n=1 Tax=Ramlibacter sp. TaxID=1917967 RepID=UPI002B5D40D3|nr:phenylacetate--CoA ligase [Ramlibacter sp.]HWI84469.1 phenylacetate--CoA ligase [Ramlibacter sp.]
MPRERLARLQLERLQATVANAYDNVPLLRQRLDAAGMRPADVRSLDDLQRLPFTVKTDLRDQYPFGLFARGPGELTRLHASSGTTGKPTVVGYTQQDIVNWSDLMARSLYAAGARRGDIIHNSYGYGLFTGGLGAHYGAERLGAVVVPMSGGSTERQITLIMDFKARVLCATPSYALALAEVAEQQGVDLRQSSLEIGLFGAEPWSAAMRHEIEERIGLKAVDIYGLSEIMGPGVACECECQDGLHGWEDNFIFEVIDPETGKVLPEGQAGELVITTLTKQALPMLRYRTRDITRLTTAPCDCGRTHVRILRITGRNDDMLIIRGVNVYPSQIEAVLVGRPHIAPHYQLVVEREGILDNVRVEVEALPGTPADQFPAVARDVKHHIKSMVGITTEVKVQAPGTVPRSQGKAVRVRDLRPKEA